MINIDGEFYIDPRETSVSEFQQCIDAAECTSENYIEHRCVGRDATHYRCNIGRPGGSSLPANCISSRGAEEYCAFKGKRLCTKEEWRKACRGPANTRYPWGDHSWDIEHNWCICNVDSHGDSNCSFHDHGSGTPCAQAELSGVINCPGCLYFHSTTSGECSFNNLFDIIGNVAEWVIDDDGSYVGMGGSFGTGDMAADCDNTSYPSPDIEYDWRNFGIRCCW
jgi:formylglycine-generating enzyme required for sulfatase activity